MEPVTEQSHSPTRDQLGKTVWYWGHLQEHVTWWLKGSCVVENSAVSQVRRSNPGATGMLYSHLHRSGKRDHAPKQVLKAFITFVTSFGTCQFQELLETCELFTSWVPWAFALLPSQIILFLRTLLYDMDTTLKCGWSILI